VGDSLVGQVNAVATFGPGVYPVGALVGAVVGVVVGVTVGVTLGVVEPPPPPPHAARIAVKPIKAANFRIMINPCLERRGLIPRGFP
jgi:hypothetical protein